VRRSFLDQIGEAYDPVLPHSADWDIWLRLCTRASVGYLATPYYAYRIHRMSMTVSLHNPDQINGEFVHTVEKAFKALSPSAPESIHALHRHALQQVLLNTTWGDRSHGRTARAWQGMLSAAKRAPSLMLAPKFYAALAKLSVLTVIGHARYDRLVSVAHSRTQRGLSLAA
jgi:hypothetical protein